MVSVVARLLLHHQNGAINWKRPACAMPGIRRRIYLRVRAKQISFFANKIDEQEGEKRVDERAIHSLC